MGGFKTQAVERTYSVKKAEFHAELLTTFLQGMTLNPSVFGALEGVLQMISDSIFSAKDTTEKSMFYLLSTVYVWDDIIKEAKPSEYHRNISITTQAGIDYLRYSCPYILL
jgi:hypothetical protein